MLRENLYKMALMTRKLLKLESKLIRTSFTVDAFATACQYTRSLNLSWNVNDIH